MNRVTGWIRQPTTIGAFAVVAGGAAYWFTGNAVIAGTVATAVLGGMNDHTATLLTRIEALEDALRSAKIR